MFGTLVLCVFGIISIALTCVATAQEKVTGGTIYMENCALCHGYDGTGPRTPDYDGSTLVANKFVDSHNDAELLQFLKVGRQPDAPDSQMKVLMPGFDYLSEADLKLLVQYLRQLSG